jgi:hypothetical protein
MWPAREYPAVAAAPFTDVSAGVLVGHAGLALDGVQKVDALRRLPAERGGGIEQPLPVSHQSEPCEVLGHDELM